MTKRYYIKYNKIGGSEPSKLVTDVAIGEDAELQEEKVIQPSLDNIAVNKSDIIKTWKKIVDSAKESCLNLPYYCKKELNEIFTKIKFYNIPLFNKKSQFLIPETNGQQNYDLNNFIFNRIGEQDMKGLSYLPMFSFKKINSFPTHEIKDVSLQEVLNLQKHQMFETIRENTRDPNNNNEAKELHNTMFLYGVPSIEVIEFFKQLEKARELINELEFNMEYNLEEAFDKEKKKIKLIIKSPKGMTSVMESKNENDPLYMTWSENTLAMFSFKQINKKEAEVPEYKINKFEYLAIIQWILYGDEDPNYERIDELKGVELTDKVKYTEMFKKAVDHSIKRVKEIKNQIILREELMSNIEKIRNSMTLNLINKKMKIIFSHDYILSRQLGIGSFVPFKYAKEGDFEKGIGENIIQREEDIMKLREKKNDKEFRDKLKSDNYVKQFDDGKCNNGSLCCESKLFSYICDKNPGKFPSQLIKGETCYWMCDLKDFKDDPPTDKTVKNYSFAGEKFKNIRDLMCREIKVDAEKEENHLCVSHFALPCPGCQINYFNYLLNKRDIWDRSDECGEEIEEHKKIVEEINNYAV